MKTRFLLMAWIATAIAISGCSKTEELRQVLIAEASFELDKEFYEIAEPIHFVNTSVNAVSYLWTFGDMATSTEANPVFTPDVHPNFIGARVMVTLQAMSEDGSSSEMKKVVTSSQRLIRKISIDGISEQLTELIPFAEGRKTELLVNVGSVGHPWFDQYKEPAVQYSTPMQLPLKVAEFSHRSWPMGNDMFFINIYARLQDDQTPLLLHSVEFIPSQMPAEKIVNNIHKFSLQSAEISMTIEYMYA
jgi:hypothetical protein